MQGQGEWETICVPLCQCVHVHVCMRQKDRRLTGCTYNNLISPNVSSKFHFRCGCLLSRCRRYRGKGGWGDNLCTFISVCMYMYVVRKPTGSGVEWAECSLIIGMGFQVNFISWSLIAQSVCQWAFSPLAIWCLRPSVWILHSSEDNN